MHDRHLAERRQGHRERRLISLPLHALPGCADRSAVADPVALLAHVVRDAVAHDDGGLQLHRPHIAGQWRAWRVAILALDAVAPAGGRFQLHDRYLAE